MLGDVQRAIILDYIIDKNMNNVKVTNLLLEYIDILNLYEIRKRLRNE